MAARQRDFQRPPRRRLALEVAEVGKKGRVVLGQFGLGERQARRPAEVRHRLAQGGRAEHAHVFDQRRLLRVARRQQGLKVVPRRQQRQIDCSRDGSEAAVQREFPGHNRFFQRFLRQQFLRGEQPQRNR